MLAVKFCNCAECFNESVALDAFASHIRSHKNGTIVFVDGTVAEDNGDMWVTSDLYEATPSERRAVANALFS
jgi:hypothetical protein